MSSRDWRKAQASISGRLAVGPGATTPGDRLFVEAAVAQAAIEYADQLVGQDSEGLVVGVAPGPVGVVEGASTGGVLQGTEGPPVAGVAQVLVAPAAVTRQLLTRPRPGRSLIIDVICDLQSLENELIITSERKIHQSC